MHEPAHPHIRSFHPRRSRITPSAQSALLRLLPVLGVEVDDIPRHPRGLFDPALPVILEIGPGMGEATVAMAAERPDLGILAVDVHTPGIGALLAGVERDGLSNVRVTVGDAVEVMARVAPGSLAGIRAYFPDPWPKVRHRKRRLVQPAFVSRAAELMAPGGTLHLATDVADYAEQMLAACLADPRLECPGLRDRPAWRPQTKYEERGWAAGRPSRDIIATKRPGWP